MPAPAENFVFPGGAGIMAAWEATREKHSAWFGAALPILCNGLAMTSGQQPGRGDTPRESSGKRPRNLPRSIRWWGGNHSRMGGRTAPRLRREGA